MKSTYLAAVAVAALALFIAPSLNACVATYPGIANYPSGNDLNDYGALFIDAGDPNCAEGAMYNLTTKLTNHVNASGSLQNWLDGYYVALIYGAALRLGEQGWANKDLDWQLDYSPDSSHLTVANKFMHGDSGICDPEQFNTCMDDFAGTAAAYAWMAAYKSRRVIAGHNTEQDVQDKRDAAADYIHRSMNAVCIRMKPIDRNEFPVCDGNVDALRAGTAETLTVNGTVQLIHYGFGLMTSVLSAAQGYEVAGGGKFPFSEPEQVIAKGLYEEIARHADSSGNYRTPPDCLKLDQNGAIAGGSPCDGSVIYGLTNPPPYLPNMYKLKGPYDYYFPGVIPDPPSSAYTSTTFDAGLFNNSHFGYGRLATYRDMGGDWIPNGAPNMPYDNHDPVDGWLDYISPSGVANGWTCDQDAPDKAIKVDIYAGELWPPEYEPPVATGYANLSSEGAVNAACGGGWAHRFQIQLPGGTQGMPIHAFGLDYTWYGFTELHCGSNPTGPCSW